MNVRGRSLRVPSGGNRALSGRWGSSGRSGWSLLLALGMAFLPGALAGQEPCAGGALTLDRAVDLALKTHPVVGGARAAEEAAGARVDQARSGLFPTLGSRFSLTRHQEPMVVAPLHAFDPMSPPSFDRNLAQGALALGYTVYDGGARGARIRQAEAGERAAGAGGREAEMAVAVRVSAAYLEVLSGREVLEAALGQMAALSAELDRVRLFLEEGKAARVDLLRVQAALSRARAQEITAASALELARNGLARLTGLSRDAVRSADLRPVRVRAEGGRTREDALAAARTSNPGLLRAREGLASARAGRLEARAAWLPTVEAGGRVTNFGTVDGGHVQEWQASVQLSYPLFTGGAREGKQEWARAEERRAGEALRQAELDLEEEVDGALAGVEEARARREALETAVVRSEEVARIEALALEAGAGVQTDFLRAQAELFQDRASLSQARHGEILARIQLARVEGRLSDEWLRDTMEMER